MAIPTIASWLKPYTLGREAFEQGLGVADCPYEDKKSDSSHPTFSRAFRTRWTLGWMDAKHGLPVRFVLKSKPKHGTDNA
jgi:hypothetical protein